MRRPTPFPPRVEAVLIGYETGRILADTDVEFRQEPRATVAEVRREVEHDLWEDLMGADVALPGHGVEAVVT